MPDTIIRLATKDDAEVIADLSRKTFYETFGTHNTRENMEKFMSRQFTKKNLMKEVGALGNVFFLALQDEGPVGYARLRESINHKELGNVNAIEIARLYAINKVIGTGVGKQLMNACFEKAQAMKKEIIWLGVWEKNKRAIDFYTRSGFKKFAEHPFIIGDDVQNDWLLKKAVPAI